MIYSDFQGLKLSKLGFGCMRLPLLEDGKTIDQQHLDQMVDYAIANGVNYFDTAWPYHEGNSEVSVGKSLARYPRESFYLATKYPGHQIASHYNPEETFHKQLEKCGVEYFDFYLLHNIYEKSMEVYENPDYDIINYFLEQKRLGKIKHLGFSSHARVENLQAFLDRHPNTFDFCQIQLNYLDYSLQEAKEKVEVLNQRNIPIWVMEPVRGGKLADLKDNNDKLLSLRKDQSIAAWAFDFLLNIKGVTVILSGMSNLDQMKDNVKTFDENKPLNQEEMKLVLEIAETMKSSLPCTKCRYCCDGCPMGLNIPLLIGVYNELVVAPVVNSAMVVEFLSEDKKPSACIGCGQCSSICPQGIDIPNALAKLSEMMNNMPKWADVCKQREIEGNKFLQEK